MAPVFKVKPTELDKVKSLLLKKQGVMQLEVSNKNEAFRVRCADYLVIGYKTGKIVATKEDAKGLMLEVLSRLKKEQKTIIGSDEAGKGEWLGPIVVAAVALNQRESNELQAQGIMDSKQLTLPKIKILADYIRDNHYNYTTVIITPKRFNELLKEFKDERQTMNDLLAWGHAAVIERLFTNLNINSNEVKIIIDEFDRIKTEERLRRVLDIKKLVVIQQPRAEEYTAVAAASIIARNAREEYIDFLSKKLNKNLRAIKVEDAISDEALYEYAKVGFIKRLLETKYKIPFP